MSIKCGQALVLAKQACQSIMTKHRYWPSKHLPWHCHGISTRVQMAACRYSTHLHAARWLRVEIYAIADLALCCTWTVTEPAGARWTGSTGGRFGANLRRFLCWDNTKTIVFVFWQHKYNCLCVVTTQKQCFLCCDNTRTMVLVLCQHKNHGSCVVTTQEQWFLCCHNTRTMVLVLSQHKTLGFCVVTTQEPWFCVVTTQNLRFLRCHITRTIVLVLSQHKTLGFCVVTTQEPWSLCCHNTEP